MKNNIYVSSVVSKIILVLFSFINSIIINRYLGPDLRGEYAFILNLTNIFAVILGLNIASSIPFFSRNNGSHVMKQFMNLLYYQMLIYLVAAFIIVQSIDVQVVHFVVMLSVLTQFSNQLDFITIISNINKRNVIMIITGILNTFLMLILFIYFEANLKYIIFVLGIYNISKILLYMIVNKSRITKIDTKEKISIKEIVKFSVFPMFITLLTIFNYNIDVVILKYFVSNSDLGLYSAGVTLAAMLWVIPDAFKEVLFNKTAISNSITSIVLSIKLNFYFSLIIIIGFLLIGQFFIVIVYGVEFENAFVVSSILLIGTIPMIFFKMINTLYQAIGKQRFSFIVLFISVITNIILNFILIPYFGIDGAAIASVVSYLLAGILMLISFSNKFNLKILDYFTINAVEIDYLKKKFK